MLHLTSKKHLSKIRRQAKKRDLRILRDGCGNFTVISTHTEPSRPLLGLDHVPLWAVERAVATPLPEPPPRRKPMARPTEPAPAVPTAPPVAVEAPAHAQAHHSFLSLVEALRARSAS